MFDYFNKKFLFNIFLIIIIFSLDRISKIYVISQSEKNLFNDLFQSKFLNINLIWNEGIAFGLLSFEKGHFYNILTFLILIVIIIIFILILKSEGLKKYSLLMILGGALGNLYDRIYFRAVPDFIDFHIGNFHWFIFNVSDIFITFGVSLMIILEIIDSKKANEKI